jgi:hypothetical protein
MEEETSEPRPRRLTGEAAFTAEKKRIAARNEAAHQAERKLRSAGERRKVAERRERDLH